MAEDTLEVLYSPETTDDLKWLELFRDHEIAKVLVIYIAFEPLDVTVHFRNSDEPFPLESFRNGSKLRAVLEELILSEG